MIALSTGHPLLYTWAYKYTTQMKGINVHADQARVNVNMYDVSACCRTGLSVAQVALSRRGKFGSRFRRPQGLLFLRMCGKCLVVQQLADSSLLVAWGVADWFSCRFTKRKLLKIGISTSSTVRTKRRISGHMYVTQRKAA